MNEILQLAIRIWSQRKLILKWSVSGFIVGLILFIGTPSEFSTKVTLLAINQNTSMLSGLMQQFGGLAGMGLGLTEQKDALTPAIYPEIVRSTPFLLSVMKQEIELSKKDTVISVHTYMSRFQSTSIFSFLKKITIGLPGTIKNWFVKKNDVDNWIFGNNPVRLSYEQERVKKELMKRINANYNSKTDILTISIRMRDADVVAQLTDTIAGLLSAYVIDYRIQKAKTDYDFIHKSYLDAKQRFQNSQQNLAEFRDRNMNIVSSVSKTKEEQLQAEFNLAFNVYNGLAQQLEQARINVQEATPVFKIIEPVKVPLRASPERYLIVFFCMVAGLFIALAVIFIKPENQV